MDDEIKVIHVVNDPEHWRATAPANKLKRPKIHYWAVPLYIAAHLAAAWLLAFIVGVCVHRSAGGALKFSLAYDWAFLLGMFVLTLRFTGIWCVRLYQRYAKPEVRLRCVMTPSCSEYAILALKKYGAIVGGIKTIKRLRRCHPPGGVDYP